MRLKILFHHTYLFKTKITNKKMELDKKVTIEIPISTYHNFFENERITEVKFLPLLKGEKEETYNDYDIDWRKYPGKEPEKILFKFFSTNLGKPVEVRWLTGFQNCIKDHAQFIVGGKLENNYIIPNEIIKKRNPGTSLYQLFFNRIYYARTLD